MLNIKTEEGDLITGELCGSTLIVVVRGPESMSSFSLTIKELHEFISALQQHLQSAVEIEFAFPSRNHERKTQETL